MRSREIIPVILFVFGLICSRSTAESADGIELPAPILKGSVSLEEAVKNRRSARKYTSRALSIEQVAQLVWAGQGVTGGLAYKRAAPSAGGLCPLELYLVVKEGGVRGLPAGVYHYIAKYHKLEMVKKGGYNTAVAEAALGQMWMAEAPLMVVITAEYSRTTKKYGQRGIRYVHIDTGLAAENIILQAVALGLTTCPVGAFHDKELMQVINPGETLDPLLIVNIGYQ